MRQATEHIMAINWNIIQRKNPRTDVKTWYPRIALNSTVTQEEIAAGIEEKCTLHHVDIMAVLAALEDVVIEQLKLGNSVRFGSLGSFRPSIKCRVWDDEEQKWTTGGCVSAEDTFQADGKTLKSLGVHSDNIAGISVVFTKSGKMNAALKRENLKFRKVEGILPYTPRS